MTSCDGRFRACRSIAYPTIFRKAAAPVRTAPGVAGTTGVRAFQKRLKSNGFTPSARLRLLGVWWTRGSGKAARDDVGAPQFIEPRLESRRAVAQPLAKQASKHRALRAVMNCVMRSARVNDFSLTPRDLDVCQHFT